MMIKDQYNSSVTDRKVPLHSDINVVEDFMIPKELIEQIKDLKKQAEELKVKVKLEKEHRHRCETQLAKAKKELSKMPRLRKSIGHLQEVRKELRGNVCRLQHHLKQQGIEKHELDRTQHLYEAMACQTLHSKWGQMRNFMDEQSKVHEHLEQMRLNNEVQLRTDMQRTVNELLEEVSHLRTSFLQSQSQVESLQEQCNHLQDLYSNEVMLRSKLTQDLAKVQYKAVEPFALTRKNILKKNWQTNVDEMQFIDFAQSKINSPRNTTDSTILLKLKAELDKSIQRHHLSKEFPDNLNNDGSGECSVQVQTSTKSNSII